VRGALSSDANVALPAPAAVRVLAWNGTGTGLVNVDPLGAGDPSAAVFNPALNYVAGTLGKTLIDRAVCITDFPWLASASKSDSDNLAAINAALAWVGGKGGGTVIVPVGSFNVTPGVAMQASGVILRGVSTTGSRLVFSGATGDDIYLQGTSSPGIYNCQVLDLTIEHSGTKTAGASIRMYRANQCQVSRVIVSNAFNAFDIKTINNVIISESVALNIRGDFGVKFWSLGDGSERSDVLTIKDTVINMSPGGGDGIVWDGFAHTLRLVSVGVLNARYGLVVKNTAVSGSYYPSFGEFFDLEIDGTTVTAARIEAGANISFAACDLFNLSTATGPIVEVLADASGSFTNGISILGGRIYGGAKEAIVMGGRNFTLSGGARVGGGSATGYSCIRIANNAQDFIIGGGCQIGTTWGSAVNKYDFGVLIEATTYRGLVGDVSFYGCLGEVSNLSSTGTVSVGSYLNRAGIPNQPASTLRRSDNNAGIFEDRLQNTSTGAAVTAQWSLATGTANSFITEALKDNAGAPFHQLAAGPAVTQFLRDAPVHRFRTAAGVDLFTMGASLPAFANDAAAAGGGVPLWGFYRNGGVVQQRTV
jgi:hypothetical protein